MSHFKNMNHPHQVWIVNKALFKKEGYGLSTAYLEKDKAKKDYEWTIDMFDKSIFVELREYFGEAKYLVLKTNKK
tara:strand:+ start:1640 stop:1864 length:225 start_codon:yes stop_codon:yes gene_type:complete